MERAIELKGLTVFASLTVLPHPETIHCRQSTYITLDLLSRPAMSSIRINEDGDMWQHYADSHDADQVNDSTRRTSNRKPRPSKKHFAGWTQNGEPMIPETGKNGSSRKSNSSRSEPPPPRLNKSFAAWTEDGVPAKERTEERSSRTLPSLKRRSRVPPSTIRITTAEVLEDDYENSERDVSMRFFPSGNGKEVEVPDDHQERAIEFAVLQQRSIPWGFASQRSGSTKAVQAFNKAEELHPWVKVIERPKGQDQGTIGCETWIVVEEPQVWSRVLP